MQSVETKACTKCKDVKPLTDFYTRKSQHGTRPTSHCKTCTRAWHREYNRRTQYRSQKAYNTSPEGRKVMRASQKRYQQSHPEVYREQSKLQRRRRLERDPVGTRAQRCRSTQIYKQRHKMPGVPREVVVAIVDARRSITRAKKALSQIEKKDQEKI